MKLKLLITGLALLVSASPSFAGGIVMMGGGVPSGVTPDTISYESNASASNTSGTNLVLTKPTGTANGDMLIAVIVQDDNETKAVTLPDGWTLIHDIVASSSRTTVAYKEAGGSEGENYTFTNTSTYKTGVMARFSKSGGTWDIQAASEAATASSVNSITSASVTATDNSMLVWCWGSDDNIIISAAPADMTEVEITAPGSLHAGMWYEERSAGAVTKTLTIATTADMAAVAIVLDLVP